MHNDVSEASSDVYNMATSDYDVTLSNFTTNMTTATPEGPAPRYWALLLCVFPLLTVFGNLLVCLSVYREKQLRTLTNYFIVSLAVSDIMVAALVMPFAVYTEVRLARGCDSSRNMINGKRPKSMPRAEVKCFGNRTDTKMPNDNE